MKKKIISLTLAMLMVGTTISGCGNSDDATSNMTEEEQAAWDEAANDP